MSFEVNGQVFESQEDYEKNYVVAEMNIDELLSSDDLPQKRSRESRTPKTMLDNRQLKWAMEGAIRAALLVYGTVAGAALLFIAFCVFVWFK